jgi:hypothetical protein
MAGNAQKTPLARELNRFAEKKILDAIQLTGKALPCKIASVDGSIVTVSFEIQSDFTLPQVTIPTGIPEYMRVPFQSGDKGFVIPADARLGGISGLGGGVAELSLPANLAALVFVPVSNNGWFTVDGNLFVMYGPHGLKLQTVDDSVHLILNSSGITIKGNVNITGDVAVTGKLSSTDEADLAGGAKKVVLDGDPVVMGVVVASSTKTKAT